MSKRSAFIIHFLYWVITLGFSFYRYTLPYYQHDGDVPFFIVHTILNFSISLIYFYFNYSFLIPEYLVKRKYGIYFTLLLLSACFMSAGHEILWNDDKAFTTTKNIPTFTLQTITYFIISAAFKMLDYWIKSENDKEALENELKETELLYLKSQMNPHFLFNTLNNIYGLSLKNNENTSSAIRQLKELVLYNDHFANSKKISIEDELTFLNSFINLFKLRSNSVIDFNPSIQTDKIYIEPMLFLPFIENAFKHGLFDDNKSISIKLDADDKKILFRISNEVNTQKRKDSTGGIGIKNVKRRLELLYPNKHSLQTEIIDNKFIVHLNLQS